MKNSIDRVCGHTRLQHVRILNFKKNKDKRVWCPKFEGCDRYSIGDSSGYGSNKCGEILRTKEINSFGEAINGMMTVCPSCLRKRGLIK